MFSLFNLSAGSKKMQYERSISDSCGVFWMTEILKSQKSFVFFARFSSSESLDRLDKLPDFGVLSQTDQMGLQVTPFKTTF